MIILFGPAGAGKSVQGQMLAARKGWRWISVGQLLRDSKDPEVLEKMQTGELVANEKVNQLLSEAVARTGEDQKIILDGYPRHLAQAKWLAESNLHRNVELVVLLDISKEEIMKRLEIRGRLDDTPEAIEERLQIYEEKMKPILDYFRSRGISIVEVDGNGSISQIHDKILEIVS